MSPLLYFSKQNHLTNYKVRGYLHFTTPTPQTWKWYLLNKRRARFDIDRCALLTFSLIGNQVFPSTIFWKSFIKGKVSHGWSFHLSRDIAKKEKDSIPHQRKEKSRGRWSCLAHHVHPSHKKSHAMKTANPVELHFLSFCMNSSWISFLKWYTTLKLDSISQQISFQI